MGWTSYHAKHYDKHGKVDRKAECDSLWNTDCKVLKSAMKGSVYYCALQEPDGTVSGHVILTFGIIDRRDPYFNFGYKAISETCGPGNYDCPKGILDLLTPTDSEWANTWRQKCRERLKAKKAAWIKDLPIGAKVEWTKWNGEKIILTKHAPSYQFRTWFWMDEERYQYVQKKLVTENNARQI